MAKYFHSGGCPKCSQGILAEEKDYLGIDVYCMNCGYRPKDEEIAAIKNKQPASNEEETSSDERANDGEKPSIPERATSEEDTKVVERATPNEKTIGAERAVTAEETVEKERTEQTGYKCPYCDRVFPKPSCLGPHKRYSHGIRKSPHKETKWTKRKRIKSVGGTDSYLIASIEAGNDIPFILSKLEEIKEHCGTGVFIKIDLRYTFDGTGE